MATAVLWVWSSDMRRSKKSAHAPAPPHPARRPAGGFLFGATRYGTARYRPLKLRTASIMATIFAAGVPAWMLCTALKTNPPFA